MNTMKNSLITLFLSTFKLSAFTFGGGYVIIPLMRKRFVEQLGWIEEQEMLDLIAIAQSAPGAIAVNASVIIGYRIAGVPGALITVLGTVLPPLVILSVVSLFYTAFRDNAVVNLIMKGMQAGVAAVILDVVFSMGRDILRTKQLMSILVLVGAFIASCFFQVNVIIILFVCGMLGAFDQLFRKRTRKEAD